MRPLLGASIASVLLLSGSASGDAGYMGSLLPGPSPALSGAQSRDVRMIAEDVFLVLLPGGDVEMTASFLFGGAGPDCTVLMAFPFELRTVFSPPEYAVDYGDSLPPWGDGLLVEVDGVPVDPFTLIQVTLQKDDEESGFTSFLDDRAFFGGASTGNVRLVIPPAWDDSRLQEFDFHHRAEAVLACWQVSIDSGDTALVEIRASGRLTSDYSESLFRLSYPLVTGASWAGTIGHGRISLVPGEGFDRETLQWYAGICMPTSSALDSWQPEMLPEFAGHSSRLLPEPLSRVYTDAVVWEFRDFEPVAGRRDTYTFYPDFGDISASAEMAWENGKPIHPWRSSFVYAFVGPEAPSNYTVISGTGLDLYDGCYRGAAKIGTVPPGSYATLLETYGGWMRLSFEETWNSPAVEGWLLPGLPGSDGIVEPEIIPAPGSDWLPQ
jgi:hypothetical protein